VAYYRNARLADARALFEAALRGAEALNGGRSTTLIGVLNDFATFNNAVGDFAAAEAGNRRALALATDLIGADSFQVANAHNNLAVILANQGRLEEAAEAFQQTYRRHVTLFGAGHTRTINTMRNVGMVLFLLDKPAACERWMSRAAAGLEKSAGRNDPSAVYMRAQLARCLVREGRVEEGIALLEPAIETLLGAGGMLPTTRRTLASGWDERCSTPATPTAPSRSSSPRSSTTARRAGPSTPFAPPPSGAGAGARRSGKIRRRPVAGAGMRAAGSDVRADGIVAQA
jgi:hypothetical protein